MARTGIQSAARPDLSMERRLNEVGFRLVAGADEAGRGCLAGPVVAAAVILPQGFDVPGVNDSKQVRPQLRVSLAEEIRREAVSWAIGTCTPGEVDSMNILRASLEAMRRAVERLDPLPDYLLIDGNRGFNDLRYRTEAVIKGDARCLSIAAASILAKTTRDEMMHRLSADYPQYNWCSNVGYPTPDHYRALHQHGPSPHHRRTFRLA